MQIPFDYMANQIEVTIAIYENQLEMFIMNKLVREQYPDIYAKEALVGKNNLENYIERRFL